MASASLRYIDAILREPPPASGDGETPTDREALDAYSTVVTTVAERLIPSVASLRVAHQVPGGRRTDGGGSAVVITPHGFLLT
jgi:hypothetical protein